MLLQSAAVIQPLRLACIFITPTEHLSLGLYVASNPFLSQEGLVFMQIIRFGKEH